MKLNKCAVDDALPLLQQLQQGDALLKTCSSPTSRFADPFQHCSLLSKILKAVNPLYSFLTAWEAKARSPFFFYGWKNCARGECLNIRNFFYGVKLNDNYKSVLCACLIAYFLCPKGKKRKVQCVFRQPMETFLVRWVFIGTL